MNEIEAITLAKKGKLEGFNFLVKSYSKWLLGLIKGIDFNSQHEDIAQEIWILVWKKISSLKDPDKFRPWLRTMAIRHIIKTKKTLKIVTTDLDSIANFEKIASTTNMDSKLDQTKLLKALLNTLNDTQRVTFMLSEIEGMSNQEISETLDIPIGTVKSRLNTIRTNLKESFKAFEKETKEVANV